MGTEIVSFSELAAYRRCPLNWFLGYHRRWQQPIVGGARARGTLWHIVMEIHYNNIAALQTAMTAAGLFPRVGPNSHWDYEALAGAVWPDWDGDPEATCGDVCLATIWDQIQPHIGSQSGEQTELQELIEWNYRGYIQCQPKGTLVRVATGGERVWDHSRKRFAGSRPTVYEDRPIEQIRPGDRVVSWARKRHGVGRIRKNGSPVSRVAQRRYAGETITVQAASGHSSTYTHDHITVATIGDSLNTKWVVYLMRRGNQYRVGHASWKPNSSGRPGPVTRAHTEGADAIWLLSSHDTKADAWLTEMDTTYRYGVPDVVFVDAGRMPIERFWSKIGDNTAQAATCLKSFGRDIRYPLKELRQPEPVTQWVLSPIEIRACNLMDGMQVLVLDQVEDIEISNGSNGSTRNNWLTRRSSPAWQPVVVVRQPYSDQVYSLEVEGDETYFADGILTHNCYGLDNRWTIIAVEHAPQVWLLNDLGKRSNYKLKMKIDLIVLDLWTGQYWVIDHKNSSKKPTNLSLEIDDQFGLYTWGLRQLGRPVIGAIHSYTKAEKLKREMTLQERFIRTPMHRGDAELDALALDAWANARDSRQQLSKINQVNNRRQRAGLPQIPGAQLIPTSPDTLECGWCDFSGAHVMGRKGLNDTERYLADTGFEINKERH